MVHWKRNGYIEIRTPTLNTCSFPPTAIDAEHMVKQENLLSHDEYRNCRTNNAQQQRTVRNLNSRIRVQKSSA